MRSTAALFVGLFSVTASLAGCIGTSDDADHADDLAPASNRDVRPLSDLSQPIYDTVVREVHRFQGEVDGEQSEEIWMSVFRPDVPEGTLLPTLLVMTPYQSLGDALGGVFSLTDGELPEIPPGPAPYDPGLVEFFVPRGYAVAFSDVRGNHNSGGCIDQTGPGQWRDGYATVEYIAEQPWSNGKVGMHGASYDGETQVSTALLNPPHLTTIVPTASVQSQYQYIYYGGVPYELSGAGTMAGYLGISLVPGTDPSMLPSYPERLQCQQENFEAGLDLSGDWNQYWEDRAYWKLNAITTASVLHIHGLGDWNVKPDNIDPLFNNWQSQKRAIYGQWGHAYPDREDWGEEAGILHRWYDHYLLGIDTGLLDELPPVLIEDTEGDWRGIDAFPLAEQSWLVYELGPDGTLSEGAEAGEITIHDYPRDQVAFPLYAEEYDIVVRTAGEAVIGHDTMATFESAELANDVILTGRPRVTFTATTDEAKTHWVATLYAATADGMEWINRGYQDTRHVAGVDQPTDITPGEAYTVTITMYPQNDVVKAGSKLVMVLTNQDEWVHQDDTYAMSTITLGEGQALLELPLLPEGAVAVPEDTLK